VPPPPRCSPQFGNKGLTVPHGLSPGGAFRSQGSRGPWAHRPDFPDNPIFVPAGTPPPVPDLAVPLYALLLPKFNFCVARKRASAF